MPQKTKKQKIHSDARRVQQFSSLSISSDMHASPKVLPQMPSFTFQPEALVKSVSRTLPSEELGAIQRDLMKTLLLAIVAIGIELFLYVRLR